MIKDLLHTNIQYHLQYHFIHVFNIFPHYALVTDINFNSILLKQTDEVQWNLFVRLMKHAKYHNIQHFIKYIIIWI